MLQIDIGTNIRKIRKERRITQAALAQKLGCEPSLLSHIERNVRTLSIRSLFKLSEALRVHPVELLSEKNSPLSASLEAVCKLTEDGLLRLMEYLDFLLIKYRRHH